MDALRHAAADVVEVDVDAVGAGRLERLSEVLVLVVDRLVVAVEAAVRALVGAARDPDRPAAGELRDLPDDLPDGARRTRHDDGVAGLRLPDVEQPEVRGHPRRADGVQRERRRVEDLGNPPNRAGSDYRVLLPAELSDDQVAGREASVLALDDLRQRLGRDHVAELELLRVRARLAHSAALVGIDGDPEHPHEDLAWRGISDLHLVEDEVLILRKALRPRGERYAPVCLHENRHVPPFSNSLRIRRLTTMRCTSSGPS